jgi:hypothetical protein
MRREAWHVVTPITTLIGSEAKPRRSETGAGKLMTVISILKNVSILHTFTLPDDGTCVSHDFNHNKGSR